ncbi:MAG: hypothetical protein ACFFDP_11405 [Promethearchaeota archaeon]
MAKRNYVEIALDISQLCEDIEKTIRDFPEKPIPLHFYLLEKNAEALCAVLEFLERVDSGFEAARLLAERVQDDVMYGLPNSNQSIWTLNEIVKDWKSRRDGLFRKLSLLEKQEVLRVDEAWHSYQEYGYWSVIVNCAVAMESRLWRILDSRNPEVLKKVRGYPKLTFGALSRAYLDDKGSFGSCIPNKYEGLLVTVNSYRNISAHAKEEEVLRREADALFNLTLTFLIDEELR